MDMNEKKAFRPVWGLSREAEEKQLALILDTARENLEKNQGEYPGVVRRSS